MDKMNEKALPMAIGLNLLLPGAGYMYMGNGAIGFGALIVVGGIFYAGGSLLLLPAWFALNIIMGLDMYMLFGKYQRAELAKTTQKCPDCAETVRVEAKVCRYCAHRFEDPAAALSG